MDGNRIVEVLLRSTHVHSDGDSLHHFIDASAHAVGTNDSLSFSIAFQVCDQLEQALRTVSVAVRRDHAVVHVYELTSIDFDVCLAEFRDCVACREADRAKWRVREDYSRHVLVVHLQRRPIVEQALGKDPTSAHGHGRQRDALGNVTDRVDSTLRRILILVGDYVAALGVDLDPSVLESKAICGGRPTNGLDDLVGIDVGTVF